MFILTRLPSLLVGFELVDLDAIVVDLDGGTLKTPTVYRSRVPPPAIAKAAKEGYEIGGEKLNAQATFVVTQF